MTQQPSQHWKFPHQDEWMQKIKEPYPSWHPLSLPPQTSSGSSATSSGASTTTAGAPEPSGTVRKDAPPVSFPSWPSSSVDHDQTLRRVQDRLRSYSHGQGPNQEAFDRVLELLCEAQGYSLDEIRSNGP